MAGPTASAPGNTVYVRNLHDRVKINEMETALRTLFEEYGTIVDVVAKTNLKAKGQAFVVFDNQQSAAKAIEDIDGFTLFGKPMSCAFARARSDATVKQEGKDGEFEEHRKNRLAEKELKKVQEAQQAKLKRPAPADQADAGGQQPPTKKGLKSTAGSKAGVVPEEFLPPNKILFARDLPEDYDADELAGVFGCFAGFKEARVVPGRAGIAFIEYATEDGAINAKKHTSGMMLGNKPISVFFQRS